MADKQTTDRQSERPEGEIDVSLVDYMLTLCYEERIRFNDSAIRVVTELQRAGREYYAGKSTKSP